VAALRFHGGFELRAAGPTGACPWLVAAEDLETSLPVAFGSRQWQLVAKIPRPTDRRDNVLLYKKIP
jgi:hypothetical protein